MAISINRCVVTKAGNTITYGDTSERRDLGGKTMAQDKSICITTAGRISGNSYHQAFVDYANMITGKHGVIMSRLPNIKNVIFNPPATVVYFEDGTKTVVKCQEGDEFDAEKGLAMAVAKRAYGNKGNYCNQMKKWVEEWNEEQARIDAREKENHALDAAMKRFVEVGQNSTRASSDWAKLIEELKEKEAAKDSEETKPWRIWWVRFDRSLVPVERCVRGKYFSKEFANEKLKEFSKNNVDCSAAVSEDDPWADNSIVSKLPLRDFDEDMEFVAAKCNELRLKSDEHKPWRIWYRQIDPSTLKAIGSGVDLQTYNTFDEAVKAAHAKYMYNDEYHFWISRNNPWTGADK